MSHEPMNQHLSAERVQAFLEGELSERERLLAEGHLASCARCAAEAEAWSLVLSRLGELSELSPSEGFGERVMREVRLPTRAPLAARIRARLERLRPAARAAHPAIGRLQDLVEGTLPSAQAARVRTHLEGCEACARQAKEWQGLLGRLDALPRLAPAEAFADRVMAHVRIPAPAAAPAPTPALAPAQAWRRAGAAVRRLVPRTRRAWAAISGVAVTPAVSMGVLLYAMFSHPTLTPGALASFVQWKLNDLAVAVWHGVVARLLESDSVFRMYSLLGSLSTAPWALVGCFAAFSVLTGTALWVLYRNLVVAPVTEGGYSHVES